MKVVDDDGLDIGGEEPLKNQICQPLNALRTLPVNELQLISPTVMELTLRLEECIKNLSSQLGVVVRRTKVQRPEPPVPPPQPLDDHDGDGKSAL